MYGYLFIFELVFGILLMSFALAVLYTIHHVNPQKNFHRKVLFAVIAVVAFVRLSNGAYGTVQIRGMKSIADLKERSPSFIQVVVLLNVIGDALAGIMDIMLVMFWLRVVRALRSFPRNLVAGFCGVFTLVLIILMAVDLAKINENKQMNLFQNSFGLVSFFLFVTAALHAFVLVRVVLVLRSTEIPATFSNRLWRHLIGVIAISTVTSVAWMFRAIVIFGRVIEVEPFFTSQTSISLSNPTFTTVYILALMNIPTLTISVAFAVLSIELMRSDEQQGLIQGFPKQSSVRSLSSRFNV